MSWEDGELRLIRPYALTNGRTRPSRDFPIESLVCATDEVAREGSADNPVAGLAAGSGAASDKSKQRTIDEAAKAILDLAQSPVSIAEIAARGNLVLGVARIFVSDLLEADLVTVTPGLGGIEPHSHDEEPPKSRVALLERVLDGLQSL